MEGAIHVHGGRLGRSRARVALFPRPPLAHQLPPLRRCPPPDFLDRRFGIAIQVDDRTARHTAVQEHGAAPLLDTAERLERKSAVWSRYGRGGGLSAIGGHSSSAVVPGRGVTQLLHTEPSQRPFGTIALNDLLGLQVKLHGLEPPHRFRPSGKLLLGEA